MDRCVRPAGSILEGLWFGSGRIVRIVRIYICIPCIESESKKILRKKGIKNVVFEHY